MTHTEDLAAQVRAAPAGDGGAVRAVLEAGLCLDRELRIAYLLGDVFELGGQDAAAVLDIEPATYVFEFADIAAAHRLIEAGEARGKIVVRGAED